MFTKIAATYTHQYLTYVHSLPPDLLAILRIRSRLYHVHNRNTFGVISNEHLHNRWQVRQMWATPRTDSQERTAEGVSVPEMLLWDFNKYIKKKMRQLCCKIEPLLCLFTMKKAFTASTEYQISINKSLPKYLHISTKWNQTKISHQSTVIFFEILEWGGVSLKPFVYNRRCTRIEVSCTTSQLLLKDKVAHKWEFGQHLLTTMRI